MREDTTEEKELKRQIAQLERANLYHRRVIDVLIAVGAVTETVVEKAREIVSSFD